MRNGLARHVKTNIKDRVKQDRCEAACCYSCTHAQIGYFSDTMRCPIHDKQVRKTDVCYAYSRRE